MTDLLFGVTMFSALGCGLVAGVLFAFSTFVMKALARLPAAQGVAAMQSINVAAINPWFMTAIFGTALACLSLVVSVLASESHPGAVYLIVGGLFYLIGTVLMTMMYHVPRNNALAAVEPSSAAGSALWANYVEGWTAWNHVRTAASLAAAASFTIALVRS